MNMRFGRALDISGVFAFSAIATYSLLAGHLLFTIGAVFAVVAFGLSLLIWQIRWDNLTDPVAVEDPASLIVLGRAIAALAVLCFVGGVVF